MDMGCSGVRPEQVISEEQLNSEAKKRGNAYQSAYAKKNKEETVVDEIVHQVPLGKGLSGALKLLKQRGTLKETFELGGRNMDKENNKPVGISENDGPKELRMDRTDEFGRTMLPKEDLQMISHKCQGKGPGKMKLEKRMKQYREELKLKRMKDLDTPPLSSERIREALLSKLSYNVTSRDVRPGYVLSSLPDLVSLS